MTEQRKTAIASAFNQRLSRKEISQYGNLISQPQLSRICIRRVAENGSGQQAYNRFRQKQDPLQPIPSVENVNSTNG